jgi:hypothetical protein
MVGVIEKNCGLVNAGTAFQSAQNGFQKRWQGLRKLKFRAGVIEGHQSLVDVEDVVEFDFFRCWLGRSDFFFNDVLFIWQFFSFLLFQNRIGAAHQWVYYVLGAGRETDKRTTILENVFPFPNL